MRRTKEEAEITKRNILKAGLEVFSSKGYKATRVEDIADRANVTTGAIYHHFGGKSDLYIALVEKGDAKTNQLAMQIIEEGGSPLMTLRRLPVRLLQFLEEDEEYRAVVELFMDKTEMASELEAVREQSIQGRRRLVQYFASLIEQGIEAGEFRQTISPEVAAQTLLGLMNGLSLLWIQDQEYFSIKERAEEFVDTLFTGLVAG